jgi:hypothetical protein
MRSIRTPEQVARLGAAHLDRADERVAAIELVTRLEVGARSSVGAGRLRPPARVECREGDGVARMDGEHGRQVAREVAVERPALERELVQRHRSVASSR